MITAVSIDLYRSGMVVKIYMREDKLHSIIHLVDIIVSHMQVIYAGNAWKNTLVIILHNCKISDIYIYIR